MEYTDYLHEYYQEERRIAIEEAETKKEFKKLLKGLTNVTGLFRWLMKEKGCNPDEKHLIIEKI